MPAYVTHAEHVALQRRVAALERRHQAGAIRGSSR